LVTLRRGDTAHAVVRIVDAGFFQPSACHPKNAIGLRVFPPYDAKSAVAGFKSRPGRRRPRLAVSHPPVPACLLGDEEIDAARSLA
jgi:hypothetical protein